MFKILYFEFLEMLYKRHILFAQLNDLKAYYLMDLHLLKEDSYSYFFKTHKFSGQVINEKNTLMISNKVIST